MSKKISINDNNNSIRSSLSKQNSNNLPNKLYEKENSLRYKDNKSDDSNIDSEDENRNLTKINQHNVNPHTKKNNEKSNFNFKDSESELENSISKSSVTKKTLKLNQNNNNNKTNKSSNSENTYNSQSDDNDSEHKDKFGIEDSNSNLNRSKDISNSESINSTNSINTKNIEYGNMQEFKSVEEAETFLEELRSKYKQLELEKNFNIEKDLWNDQEFPFDKRFFYRDGELPKKLADVLEEVERPNNNIDGNDAIQKLEFFFTEKSNNINYQYKIKKGLMNDKYFIGCIMMLFKAKEEFFSNLVLDYDYVNENIKYGFCGFQFFINGEWKYVVVDTSLPIQESNEYILSNASTSRISFWLILCCKAYAKVYRSYDVLNDVSIKNVLVDITGGTAKKVEIPQGSNFSTISPSITDIDKKIIFEELRRCILQNYLIGCMKEEEIEEDDLDDSQSENNDDDEILTNSMYVILDVQDVDGLKLVYLNNSWGRGKWTGPYGPEDENWETNKGLKEKLNYDNHPDGTFWMQYSEFLDKFDCIYYCRIYPDNWNQFVIPGNWSEETCGGSPIMPEDKLNNNNNKMTSPNKLTNTKQKEKHNTIINSSAIKQNNNYINSNPNSVEIGKKNINNYENGINDDNFVLQNNPQHKKAEIKYKEVIKRISLPESDDRWFLNPQYKIELKPMTKLIISLMQEDERISKHEYKYCNFILLLCSGKYSRVWDIKEENIIKRAVVSNDNDLPPTREILAPLDYFEVLKKLAIKKKKKVITKHESIFINLIPYIEYKHKYDYEKIGNNQRSFKLIREQGIYWLRLFSSEKIVIYQLPQPFNYTIEDKWDEKYCGGSRFLHVSQLNNMENNKDSKIIKLVENSHWPMNPQYLLHFKNSNNIKIIVRKTTGSYYHDSKIGLIITKPDLSKFNICSIKSLKATGNYKKNDAINRVLESTNKILESKSVKIEEVDRKLLFNASEWVLESSYNGAFSASIYVQLNKIDSPILVIPTLESNGDMYNYSFSSNKYLIKNIYYIYSIF